MKWYSVNKYKPCQTVTECLIRVRGGGCYIGHNCEMSDGTYEWRQSRENEELLSDVTHFCILEPIEIEE